MSVNAPQKTPKMDALVKFAHELADLARPIALHYFRSDMQYIENKIETGFDPVTLADREIEAAMRNHIQKHRPDDGILGEEFGNKDSKSGLTWVIDPIDGTRAFITGAPTWGVLIALHDGTQPILGVIDQPFTAERFIAKGCDLACYSHQGRNIDMQVRTGVELGDACLFSTAPEIFDKAQWAAFERLSAQVKLRRFGFDCYAYGLLAIGQVDLVVEAGLSPYDIQAPIAVIKAAGGVITAWDGGSADQGGTVIAAGDAALHAAALAVLNRTEAI